ncbi:unnamed protein product [Orchesella dallaii]|uniref:Uncharacterized protein n=1 Tax=Orchesella dallaii TaxID=48710 RepID=A0ABP1PJB5_9HEXA
MGVGLIIGTKKQPPEQTDTETVLGNCQLWIYGAHILDLYTVIEFLIVCYFIFSVKNFQGSRAILVAVLAIIKIVFRVVAFVVVKLFMADLNRPSCSCPVPPQQQQTQLQQHQQQQQQQVHQQQQQTQTSHQPQMMVPAPPPNSQFQPASYHPS